MASLASVLFTAACQHNPVSQAGEQYSLAEEAAVEAPAFDAFESDAQPVADNETAQGRADNRRVEIRVTGLGPWPEDAEMAFLPEC